MSTVPATAPTPGLIASLNVRIWLDHTGGGCQFVSLLLTHPPARRNGESAETIERDMRLVADSLRAAPPNEHVPYVGKRVAVRDSGLLILRFDGGGHVLRVRKPARLGPLLEALGHVVLVVGLDPLDSLAGADHVDHYIQHGGTEGRLRLAAAGVDVRLSLL